jgi:hypothetical protein
MAEFYFVPSLEAKMVNAARIDARKLLQPGVYITKYTATEVDVALWVQRARVDQYYESVSLKRHKTDSNYIGYENDATAQKTLTQINILRVY